MESITKELREWFESGYVYKHYGDDDDDFKKVIIPWFGWRIVIEGMLDRIDEAHERVRAESIIDMTDESMAEHGWVKLPVDADGVPIRVGDVMECGDGTVFTVERISLYEYGWRCDGEGIDANGYKCTAHALPDCCHHHRTPTVEDVLREIVHKCQPTYSKDGSYTTGLTKEEFAEYAAKLRLAGDE